MTHRLSGEVYQCAVNFSEGRRFEVVEAIALAMEAAGGTVIDWSLDPDHNRSVVTVLGDAQSAERAVIAGAREATVRIDLRAHVGAHPRCGALDVAPVTPVRHATRGGAIEVSRRIGAGIAALLQIPVFFYEWSAAEGRPSDLPTLRRSAEEAFGRGSFDGALLPDLGPARPHPTAGATVAGARGPLVAFNVVLARHGGGLSVARQIARDIRRERDRRPELNGVRALGVPLESRGLAQVSLNLTRAGETTLAGVLSFVRERAAACGAQVQETELIGAVASAALGAVPRELQIAGFRPEQVLEHWLPEEQLTG